MVHPHNIGFTMKQGKKRQVGHLMHLRQKHGLQGWVLETLVHELMEEGRPSKRNKRDLRLKREATCSNLYMSRQMKHPKHCKWNMLLLFKRRRKIIKYLATMMMISLQRARKVALKRQDEGTPSGIHVIALHASSTTKNSDADSGNRASGESQEKKVVFTEMEEFVWGLQLDEEAHDPDAEDV